MTSASPPDDMQDVTGDFIFGDLSGGEHLIAELKASGLGLRHANRTVPAVPEAGAPVAVICTAGADLTVNSMAIRYTTDGSIPDESSPALPMRRDGADWNDLAWGYVETWTGAIPARPPDTLVSYRVVAHTLSGEMIWADPDRVTGEPGLFAYWLGSQEPPGWAHDAIVYHVFVDRFAPDPGRRWNDVTSLDEFWGGTLNGLRARLPYLVNLGVNCLWLSPIVPSPSHHGYDATDYVRIEPRLGTLEDFRALVAEAHAAGLHVILDFVANHCSDRHPLFQRALSDPVGPERGLFKFDAKGGYASFFGVGTMPEWALDREPARALLLEAARFWLDLGVDGFRLDYVMGPSHAFWAAFRQETNRYTGQSGRHPVAIGEITSGAANIATYQGRLDGALDFLLLQQVRAFFAFDLIDAGTFGRFLERHFTYVTGRLMAFSFLDNHDMNRFLWVARGDTRRLRLAALLQFVLPSPPIIYYGTEAGLSQERDLEYPDGSRKLEESRTLMPWDRDQDDELLDFYQRLIRLRRSIRDVPHATVTCLPGFAPGLLCLRIGHNRELVLNRSEHAATWAGAPIDASVAFATGADVRIAGGAVTLPPMSGCLLRHA